MDAGPADAICLALLDISEAWEAVRDVITLARAFICRR